MEKLPQNTIMRIIKPLYGIPEAGMHWYTTYYRHHQQELGTEHSSYDPCLLITTTPECFGIVGIQTDDTLLLGDKCFALRENTALFEAKLQAKPHEQLQAGKIVNNNNEIMLLEQRARGAYIATICQPEAAYDLSHAAQFQNPTSIEVNSLNKRLQRQIDNKNRGLRCIGLDLHAAKLFVFVDASFASNRDLSSHMGYVIVLANESTSSTEN